MWEKDNSELDSGGRFQTEVDVISSKVLHHLLIPVRELQGVVKQLVSCRHKRGQAQARLAEPPEADVRPAARLPLAGAGRAAGGGGTGAGPARPEHGPGPRPLRRLYAGKERTFSSYATEAENKMEQMF